MNYDAVVLLVDFTEKGVHPILLTVLELTAFPISTGDTHSEWKAYTGSLMSS